MNQVANKFRLGRIAFEAYRSQMGNIAVDGSEIPEWEEINHGIRTGWIEAAWAVKKDVDSDDVPVWVKIPLYTILVSFLFTFALGILFICYKGILAMAGAL